MPGSARSLELHPAARVELKDATEWYLARSVTAAAEFVHEIDHALARIEEAPERYPTTSYGRHRFVLLSFPFDVVYRFALDHVEVIAVAHHSRRPGYWRGR
jgi:toxin ParE1/3/4